MEAFAVDLQLLRSMMVNDLQLTVGRSLMARVASVDGDGRGRITLAGAMLEAELPKELKAGQEIRLQVRELTLEKVVLALQERPPVLDQPVMMALPGGGMLEIREKLHPTGEGDGSGEVSSSTFVLSLVYDAPVLGAIEMRFTLDPTSLRLDASLAMGEPFELAQASSDELRAALTATVARTITVELTPRHDPVDLYV
jgi:hypothetical protein